MLVEQNDAYPRCPVTPDFIKGGETLEPEGIKDKRGASIGDVH